MKILKKKDKSNSFSTKDWAALFDLCASQYGWTVEEFLSHTPRQIELITTPLNNRRHNDSAFQINLHGGKAEYKDGEIDSTLDWVYEQQKQNNEKVIDDSMKKEMRDHDR